jgi:hypothetical protein
LPLSFVAVEAETVKDAGTAAIEKKINDYCVSNPAAPVSRAMEKALQ